MHKRIGNLLVAVLAVCCLSSAAMATEIGKDAKIGIGLGGGSLTSGLSGKLYIGDSSAIQAVGGINGWGMSFGADYIKEFGTLYDHSAGKLFWGVGAGAGVILYDLVGASATIIGVSGIIEFGWHFKSFPLEIVSDWRPTFFIGDYIGGLYIGGGGGAIRWFF